MADYDFRIDFNDILSRLDATERETQDVIAGTALLLKSRIQQSVQQRSPSSGATTRYDPERTVFPAAEGYAPNTDTGNLVASVQEERITPFLRQVIVGAEYAEALEYGGWPFVIPAADGVGMQLPQIATAILGKLRG